MWSTKAIPAITDMKWSYALLGVLPFNAIKDAMVIIVTFLIYRSIHTWLHWELPKAKEKGRLNRPFLIVEREKPYLASIAPTGQFLTASSTLASTAAPAIA
jgi:hypothetical protein